MTELAETLPSGAARGAAGAGLAKLVLFLAFAVFTVWIHYQVKFVRVTGEPIGGWDTVFASLYAVDVIAILIGLALYRFSRLDLA